MNDSGGAVLETSAGIQLPRHAFEHRISTPFFLRPHRDATFDPKALKSPAIRHLTGESVTCSVTVVLPATVGGRESMKALDSNANGTRDRWVWKQVGNYYSVRLLRP
eukprot:scaffold115_cov304-Prasinococcus_capsulatus_cf.AAC.1